MSLLRQVFRVQRAHLSHQFASFNIVAGPPNRPYSTRKRSATKPKRHVVSPQAAVDIPGPPPLYNAGGTSEGEGKYMVDEEQLKNLVLVTVPNVSDPPPDVPVSTCFVSTDAAQGMSESVPRGFPTPLPKPSQTPTYHIMPVPGAGVGVFAACDFKLGDLIMAERPLALYPRLLQRSDSLARALVREMPISNVNSLLSLKSGFDHSIRGTLNTNGFTMPTFPWDNIHYGMVFNNISRFNHSCSPNAHLHWDLSSFSGGVRAIRPIPSGAEIRITYMNIMNSREQRRGFLSGYGFECMCKACNVSDAQAATSDRRRADLESLALDQADESGLEEWLNDLSLPDDYIIAACKAIWQELEEEGCGYPLTVWPGLLQQICKAYCALGDVDGARNWARKGLYLSLACGGDVEGWRKVYEAPQETTSWKRRVRAKASAHKK